MSADLCVSALCPPDPHRHVGQFGEAIERVDIEPEPDEPKDKSFEAVLKQAFDAGWTARSHAWTINERLMKHEAFKAWRARLAAS